MFTYSNSSVMAFARQQIKIQLNQKTEYELNEKFSIPGKYLLLKEREGATQIP